MTKTQPVLDMEMQPKSETALAVEQPDALVAFIERAVHDTAIDVEKLDRLMQMHERATARVARERFNAAMTAAQKQMRPIAADADNPQTKSRYASYNALDRALRPIYTNHGFGLSFNTGDGAPVGWVRVLCDVTHSGGHEKQYKIDMPADGKGAKGGDVMTLTHATGAAASYGSRYLLKMIFNVSVGEDDRDGNDPHDREPPDGYDDWIDALESKAEEGLPALQAMWRVAMADETLKSYASYMTNTNRKGWETLKAKAAKIKAVTR